MEVMGHLTRLRAIWRPTRGILGLKQNVRLVERGILLEDCRFALSAVRTHRRVSWQGFEHIEVEEDFDGYKEPKNRQTVERILKPAQ